MQLHVLRALVLQRCCGVCVQITALKNLDLNIRRAKLTAHKGANTFYITEVRLTACHHLSLARVSYHLHLSSVAFATCMHCSSV